MAGLRESVQALVHAVLMTSATEKESSLIKVTLHSDNGGAMRGAALVVSIQKLGLDTAVLSAVRGTVTTPIPGSLFKTMKYVPYYPEKHFEGLTQARGWPRKVRRMVQRGTPGGAFSKRLWPSRSVMRVLIKKFSHNALESMKKSGRGVQVAGQP